MSTAKAERIPFKVDPDGYGFEMVNPGTGKREHWQSLTKNQDHGRVEVHLICYPDELVTENEGLALYAEQMAELRVFAAAVPVDQCPDDHALEAARLLRTMVENDPKATERLRAWYVRDVEMGNKHRYPPATKGGGS